MNILIIEDEALAAKRTSQYLEQYGHGMQQVGWCQSNADAKEWLFNNESPQLIISDIELLDGNVFSLFEQVDITCPVVFATAYDQFLLKAFEANGVGYLLKPYTYEQFAAAMDKVRSLTVQYEAQPQAPAISEATLTALRSALIQQQVHYRERLTIKRATGITILQLTDVTMLISEHKVTFAVDVTGKRHPVSQSLSALSDELDPSLWYQVNRAEIIHLPHITRIENYGRDRLAVHLQGTSNPAIASRDKTPGLRKWVA